MKSKTKALVTGGAGFIGSHLVRALKGKGHEVIVYDDLSGNVKKVPSNGAFFKVDVSRPFDMPKVNIVYHLAADSIIPEEKLSYFKRNVDGTYNVLDGMMKKAVKNIVFSSGGTVYGDVPSHHSRNLESDCPNPCCLYGASKIASEHLIKTASEKYGFNYWIYRFGNVVGSPMDHAVIHDFLVQIKQYDEIRMHGDGKQERAFTHVSDVVNALVTTLDRPVGVYNLAADGIVSVNRVAEIIMEVLGRTVPVKHLERWSWDINRSYPDNSKLKGTGWSPKYDSEEAVRKAAEELVKEI
jgi:UDP-glucose 4-epimerase